MPVMGATRFERFFRVAAGLHVDKNDLKRYGEFVDQKLYDLLLAGRATAKANGRDIMQPYDLPITKGLQENLHRFRQIDEEVELAPILEQLAARPPLDVTLADSTESRLPGKASSRVLVSASSGRISRIVWRAAARLLPSWRSTGVKVPICAARAGESESVRKWS